MKTAAHRSSSTKKVLVTGADGFIGSHLVEALCEAGYEVRAFVWYNARGSWGWLDELAPSVRKSIEIFSGDIRDPWSARKAVRGCQKVLHLAALIGIPYSYEAPDSYVETNIRGTLNLLQAAAEESVERFVHTSTSEVYGSARTVPITEDHPLGAQSPYAASKIGADQLALSFFCSFQLPVVVLRPFNTYGPRQSARAIIPTIISQLLAGQTRIKLGSLHPTRDLTFVKDTVRGFIAATEAPAAPGEVIQLGTDHETSMGDLALILAGILGKNITIECDELRVRPEKSEVSRLRADFSKAARLLGWNPEYAGADGLIQGLTRTVEWFSNPSNLARYRVDSYQI